MSKSYHRYVSGFLVCAASVALFRSYIFPEVACANPWADEIIDYLAGATANPGFLDPSTALGEPERFTGEGVFPGAVTMFNPTFGTDEIVSIGEGGHLIVRFDDPILDDPTNPFGVDLIVFGNAGFIDADFPNGTLGDPAALFGAGMATIEVSADGMSFFDAGGFADGLFPTQGYLDVGPFDGVPGSVPSDFLKPVNPALSLSDFDGLSYAEALALYDGSGGGTPIDIAATGLSAVSYLRVSLADDGDGATALNAEIDAFANVPEPASFGLLVMAGLVLFCRRPRRTSAMLGRGAPSLSTRGR